MTIAGWLDHGLALVRTSKVRIAHLCEVGQVLLRSPGRGAAAVVLLSLIFLQSKYHAIAQHAGGKGVQKLSTHGDPSLRAEPKERRRHAFCPFASRDGGRASNIPYPPYLANVWSARKARAGVGY